MGFRYDLPEGMPCPRTLGSSTSVGAWMPVSGARAASAASARGGFWGGSPMAVPFESCLGGRLVSEN